MREVIFLDKIWYCVVFLYVGGKRLNKMLYMIVVEMGDEGDFWIF